MLDKFGVRTFVPVVSVISTVPDLYRNFKQSAIVSTAPSLRTKSNRSYTKTITERENKRMRTANSQWDKRRYNVGRFEAYKKFQEKDTKGAVDQVIVRWSSIRPVVDPTVDSNYGDQPIGYLRRDAATPTLIRYPIHVYNLSTVVQPDLAATDVNDPAAGFELYTDDGIGTLKWKKLVGRGADGTTLTSKWSLEKSSKNAFVSVGRMAHHTWSRIKMQLYGTRLMDVDYVVELIKFNQDKFTPEFVGDGVALDAESSQAWKTILKPLLNSKIASQSNSEGPTFKVMRAWKVHFSAKELSDVNADPYSRIIDIFYRQNAVYNYQKATDSGPATGDLDNDRKYMPVNVELAGLPTDLMKGCYLMIRAYSPVLKNTYDAGFKMVDLTPTYDINIRRCYRVDQ